MFWFDYFNYLPTLPWVAKVGLNRQFRCHEGQVGERRGKKRTKDKR